MKIFTFDTTLRDGTQGESVSFSVDDKLTIARKRDDPGLDYIEGAWPGSNPKARDVFARATELKKQGKTVDETVMTIQDELQDKYPRNGMVGAIRAAYNEAL